MTAASVQQVKQELADRVNLLNASEPTIRCYAGTPPSPQPPALGVRGPLRWTYSDDFDGDWSMTLALDVLVSVQDQLRAQQSLDAFISPVGAKSIKAVIEQNEVTTGIIQSLQVIGGVTPYAFVGDQATTQLMVATIEVAVIPFIA